MPLGWPTPVVWPSLILKSSRLGPSSTVSEWRDALVQWFSNFFGRMGVWKGTKSSDKVAKLAILRIYLLLPSLSVWLQQHTHQTYTHIQEYLDHRQSEGGVRPSLSLIGLDHDMGLMCVCSWTTWRLSESWILFFSRTAGRTSETSDFVLVVPLRN